MATNLRADTRGQSIGILRFFLSLFVGAICGWMISLVGTPILDYASGATTVAKANTATMWMEQVVLYAPLWFALIAFFGHVALSLFLREMGT